MLLPAARCVRLSSKSSQDHPYIRINCKKITLCQKINKIKPASSFQQGGTKNFTSSTRNNKTEEYIIKQNALTNACNIVGTDDVAKILEIADAFKEWVLNDVKPTNDSNGKDLPF